jgi:hypothetical protein
MKYSSVTAAQMEPVNFVTRPVSLPKKGKCLGSFYVGSTLNGNWISICFSKKGDQYLTKTNLV